MTLIPGKREQPPQQFDTRERIIQTSIELFNKKGIPNVTLRRIASEAKISIGNLTYHFKRKEDLLRATLDLLRDRLTIALARPVEVASLQFGVEYLIRVYTTLWEFRFYFNALMYLLNDDAQLRQEYYEFRDWLLDTVEGDLSYLSKRRLWRKPELPNSHRLQAENIWSLWLNWLRMYPLDNLSGEITVNKALYDCALHHWSLCQGWLAPGYSRNLLKRFQAMLLPGERAKSGGNLRPRRSRAK